MPWDESSCSRRHPPPAFIRPSLQALPSSRTARLCPPPTARQAPPPTWHPSCLMASPSQKRCGGGGGGSWCGLACNAMHEWQGGGLAGGGGTQLGFKKGPACSWSSGGHVGAARLSPPAEAQPSLPLRLLPGPSPQVDVFSFAVLCHEMLTGEVPWRHLAGPMQVRIDLRECHGQLACEELYQTCIDWLAAPACMKSHHHLLSRLSMLPALCCCRSSSRLEC